MRIGLLGLALAAPAGAATPSQVQCPQPPPLGLTLTNGHTYIPESIAILGLAPQAVVAEDFNLDGYGDLAVSYLRCDPERRELDPAGCGEDDRNGRVVLFLGQAAGSFTPAERAPRVITGEAPRFLAVRDFNGDCFPDLAVSNFGSAGGRGSLSVLLNDAGRSFRSARPTSLDGNGRGIVAGDFDNDGQLDLAVVLSNRRTITIFKGDGQGKFDCCLDLPTGPAPQTIVAADLNNDGFLDLATANASSSNSVTILLNDQKGDFSAVVPLVVDDSPFDLAAGDLNQDGFIDIVTAHAAATDSLWVWLGNGQGAFALKGRFPAGTDPIRVLLRDFNGDGHLDAIAVNGAADQLNVLLGDGQGHLGAPTAITVGQTPLSVALADLNRDGLLDVMTANQSSNDVSIRLQQGP